MVQLTGSFWPIDPSYCVRFNIIEEMGGLGEVEGCRLLPRSAGRILQQQQPPSKLSAAAAATADSDRKVAKIDKTETGANPCRKLETNPGQLICPNLVWPRCMWLLRLCERNPWSPVHAGPACSGSTAAAGSCRTNHPGQLYLKKKHQQNIIVLRSFHDKGQLLHLINTLDTLVSFEKKIDRFLKYVSFKSKVQFQIKASVTRWSCQS